MKTPETENIPRTYFFYNLGCPKNLVDAESAAGALERSGWSEARSPEDASLLVITTCAFIAAAEEESVNEILSVAAAKGSRQLLAVLGCLVTREGGRLAGLLPEVDLFLPVSEMLQLPSRIEPFLEGRKLVAAECGSPAGKRGRKLFTPPHLAYLKISEGCSNHCSYCMIPAIRGELRSRSADSIIEEAEGLARAGVKEIVIIAQDTSAWGIDCRKPGALYRLLDRIAEIEGPEWRRLMYLHPAHADADRIAEAIRNGSIIPYLDLPVQHVSDRILDSMKRGYSRNDIERLLDGLSAGAPGLVLRTTLMVGYPGETEDEFRELVEFVEDRRFDHVGVFRYSAEKGTAAYGLEGIVGDEAALDRLEEITSVQMDISHEKLWGLKGKRIRVLVDESGSRPSDMPRKDVWGVGRYYGQAHEVDGLVYLSGHRRRQGDFTEAVVTDAEAYDLFAETDEI